MLVFPIILSGLFHNDRSKGASASDVRERYTIY